MEKYFMEQLNRYIEVPWPEEFIGKWVAVTVFGTHGSYEIATNVSSDSLGIMCFHDKEQAELNAKHVNLQRKTNYSYEFMQISKGYPVLQLRVYTCGADKQLITDWIVQIENQKK